MCDRDSRDLTIRSSTDLEFLAVVAIDPDEEFRVKLRTDAVRDTMSTVLRQALLLGDDLETRRADPHLHVESCGT